MKPSNRLFSFWNSIYRANQTAAAAAVADLGKYHGFFPDIHQGMEAAEFHAFFTAGAAAGIELRQKSAYCYLLCPIGLQK